jgi:ketosteroid isomerase-like protein
MTTTATSLEERIDRQESRDTINDLVANYNRGVDSRDADLFMSLWHEDATYDVTGPFDAYAGLEGIRRGAQDIWDALAETHHWTTNVVLEFEDSDHVSGRSDVGCELIDNAGVFVLVAASYRDRFERREGVWKFTQRDVDIHYRRTVTAESYD